MADRLAIDDVATALAEELNSVCGARFGGEASMAPTDLPVVADWTISLPLSGAADGRLSIWFDGASAAACARVASGTEAEPDPATIEALLAELASRAGSAVAARPGFERLTIGAPIVAPGAPAADARGYYIAIPNTISCRVAVGVERGVKPARPSDDQLGTVLDVDLPLVVRFGRTVLPFRSIADLGPGSVLDMGRSPDEPVDLLVGERLIARGEVVVVGGNYGVRITQLAGGREAAVAEGEARRS